MRIVVTGAAGFIGGHLLERLIKEEHECIAVDSLKSYHDGILPQWFKKTTATKIINSMGNCIYPQAMMLLEAARPDVIFNLAVMPLAHSIQHPVENFEENTKITLNLLELCRRKNIRMIHFSSSEVYGTIDRGYLSEKSATYPKTPYAAAKLACDELVNSYVNTYGLKASIIRPFNTVGPRQNETGQAAIVPKTIRHIKNREHPVIYGDGMTTRDYTAISDIINGTIMILNDPNICQGHTFNLCRGEETSTNEIVKTICGAMNYKGTIDYTQDRPGDVRRHQGDHSKATIMLGWTPRIGIEEMIKQCLNE